jgi:hypothetical protein
VLFQLCKFEKICVGDTLRFRMQIRYNFCLATYAVIYRTVLTPNVGIVQSYKVNSLKRLVMFA